MLRRQGFSLIEVLLVLALLTWLATLALPAFQQQIYRAQRVVATAELWELMLRQEQFFTRNRRYTAELSELGFPAGDHYFLGREGEVQEQPGIYRIAVELPTKGPLRLVATAVGRQAGDTDCGRLWLDSSGERGSSAVPGAGDEEPVQKETVAQGLDCWR